MSEPSEEELWGELDVAGGQRRGEILLELADRCFQRQDMSQFGTLVDAAAEACASAGDDRLAAYARFNQGQGLMETGAFADAAPCFLQAAGFFHAIGAESDVAMCHQRAGDAFSRSGDVQAALREWQVALRLFDACDDPLQTGRTWMLIGGEQIAASELAEAEESFFAARTAFRQAGSATHVAWADDSAAEALILQNRIDDAATLLRACLDIVMVGSDPQGLGYAALRLGMAVRMLGDAEEALGHLDAAREAFRQADDYSGLARCDLEAARAWRLLGDHDKAEALLQRARSIFDGVGADSFLLQTDHDRAQLFLDAGRFREAEAVARECQRLAVQASDHDVLTEATMLAAVALLEQGEADHAMTTVEAHLGRPSVESGNLSARQLLVWARVLVANGEGADARHLLDALTRNDEAMAETALHAEVRELLWRLRSGASAGSAAAAWEGSADATGDRAADATGGRAVEATSGRAADATSGRAADATPGRAVEEAAYATSAGAPDGDLARAIALHLAAGDIERAQELSAHLLPARGSASSAPATGHHVDGLRPPAAPDSWIHGFDSAP